LDDATSSDSVQGEIVVLTTPKGDRISVEGIVQKQQTAIVN
jgi:uncharacterized membrane-anchored protein